MTPQYPAAAELIRAWIVRERLVPGTILPPGKELASQFGLTEAVTARACLVLVTGGLLSREGRKLRVSLGGSRTRATEGVIYVLSYSENFSRNAGRILAEEGLAHRLIELSPTKHLRLEPVLEKTLLAKPAGMIISTLLQEDENMAALLAAIDVPLVVCGDETVPSRSSIRLDAYRGTETALNHLRELGHRHIAHVMEGNGPIQRELAGHYHAACLKLGLKEAACTIWRAENKWHESVYEALFAGRKRHPRLTAIFGNDRVGTHAAEIFSVPAELSVVGLGGFEEGLRARPPLTTVALRDPDAMPSLACADLISQMRRVQSGLPSKPPLQAMLVPDLIQRQSTRALVPQRTVSKTLKPALPRKEGPWASWGNIYPFLKRNRSQEWLQLDLSKPANHSMTRQHGWLGAGPLLHFPPGLRPIHGVPFQILNEEENEGRAVVTFRSPQSHSSEGEELPIRQVIEVNARARAIYFLHGCGFVKPLAFAKYVMNSRQRGPISAPVVPLGSRHLARKRLGSLQPNVQDWWPEFGQEHFPHAHYASVFDPSDPAAYERFIYSLEWMNPMPEDEIESIEVRVDPKAGPTLALIAITVLL